jgi:hypothetical protein
LIIAGVTIATISRQHLTYDAPYPAIKASNDSAVIEKGKTIALVTKGCVHCHSPAAIVDSMLKRGETPSFAGAKKSKHHSEPSLCPTLRPMSKQALDD